jgi:hypothetical protein
MMVVCTAAALAVIIAGDSKQGLALMTIEPFLLVFAAALAWSHDGTLAITILVAGPVAMVLSYALAFAIGALVRRQRGGR